MKIDGKKVVCFVNRNIWPCDDHKSLSCEPYRVKTQRMKTKYIEEEKTSESYFPGNKLNHAPTNTQVWECGGLVVSTLDFRSEGRCFEAQSLPSCCFLRQENLPHSVFLHPGV